MSKVQLRKEARALQGTSIQLNGRGLRIAGDSSCAQFESGGEGIVLLATDESTGQKLRVKCFWNPDDIRRRRSDYLVQLKLANLRKPSADALGGAPIGMLPEIAPSIPFAVLMRNISGESWHKLRMIAEMDAVYKLDNSSTLILPRVM